MNNIKRKDIKSLAKALLFEHVLNEFRLPLDHDMDAGKNMRHSMFDRPASEIDGENNYDSIANDEDVHILPITADEIMPAIHIEKIDSKSVEDDQYVPSNPDELIRATHTLIYNHKKDIGSKEIQQAWATLSKIVDKVK